MLMSCTREAMMGESWSGTTWPLGSMPASLPFSQRFISDTLTSAGSSQSLSPNSSCAMEELWMRELWFTIQGELMQQRQGSLGPATALPHLQCPMVAMMPASLMRAVASDGKDCCMRLQSIQECAPPMD
jgi:hypothetical protein